MPSTVSSPPPFQCDVGKSPHREIGSGSLEVDGVEAPLPEPARDTLQHLAPLLPGGDRIVLVEAADVDDLLPELAERGLRVEVGVHELRPLRGRPGRDAPVHRALVDHRRPLLDAWEDVAPEAPRIQVVEEMGCDRTAE